MILTSSPQNGNRKTIAMKQDQDAVKGQDRGLNSVRSKLNI